MLSNCLAWKRRKSSKINKPARMGSMEKIRRIASRSGSGQSVCSNTQKMEDEQSMDHPSAPPVVAADGSARPIRMLDERSSSLFSVQAKIDRQEANRNRAQALFSQVDQQMEIQHKFNGRRPSSGIIDSPWYSSRWDETLNELSTSDRVVVRTRCMSTLRWRKNIAKRQNWTGQFEFEVFIAMELVEVYVLVPTTPNTQSTHYEGRTTALEISSNNHLQSCFISARSWSKRGATPLAILPPKSS